MKRAAFVLAFTLVAAACGGSDDGSDASVTTAPPESAATSSTPSAGADDGGATTTTTTTVVEDESASMPVGASGSFTVNDEEFAVAMVLRCIPFSDAAGNIDLQALAQGAQLNLTVLSGMLDASVQGTSILQMFGSVSFEATFVADGFEATEERFTGTATATDVFSSETVDLTWDVAVPSEIQDCSL